MFQSKSLSKKDISLLFWEIADLSFSFFIFMWVLMSFSGVKASFFLTITLATRSVGTFIKTESIYSLCLMKIALLILCLCFHSTTLLLPLSILIFFIRGRSKPLSNNWYLSYTKASGLQMISTIASVISPVLIMFIFKNFALSGAILFVLVLEVLALVLFEGTQFKSTHTEKQQTSMAIGLILFLIVFNFFWSSMQILIPYTARNALSNESFAIGFLGSAFAFGSIIGSYFFERAKFSIPTILLLMTILFGLIISSTNIFLSIASFILQGTLISLLNIKVFALLKSQGLKSLNSAERFCLIGRMLGLLCWPLLI